MLITVAKIKTHLGITSTTYDGVLIQIAAAVDKYIKTFCGWNIEQETIDEKIIDGDPDKQYISLGGWPIADFETPQYNAGTKSSPNWTLVDEDDFELYEDEGVLYWYKIFAGVRNIKLSYSVGYEAIPADLEFVALRMAARAYEKRKSEGVGSESVEGVSISWAAGMDAEDKSVLESYRVKSII